MNKYRHHLLEVQKLETMWKEKINKELLAAEERKKQLGDVERALTEGNMMMMMMMFTYNSYKLRNIHINYNKT
jgi:hypothetical protein